MPTITLEESRIRVDSEKGFQRVVIHQHSGGAKRFFLAAFLIFWLGGWSFGWLFSVRQLVAAERSFHDLFQLLWLSGWTLGGIIALLFLYRLLRPPLPEILILSEPHVMYDSGIPPMQFPFRMKTKKEIQKALMPQRIRAELNPNHLKTLRLRELGARKRLTLDTGEERVEIGASVSDSEREWLYNLMNSKYNS